MTVKFKFDYVLNLHNRISYINAIEKDGVEDEVAYRRSLTQVNRHDIRAIHKNSDGSATILMKKNNVAPLTTVEEYDEVLDTMQSANLAVDIMHQEKVYIFDEFEVDSDELNVCQNWRAMRDIEMEENEK